MQLPTAPSKPQPHLAVNEDLGTFVHAVHQMPPGSSYMAAGTFCSWSDWIETWGRVSGATTSYRQVSPETMVAAAGDRDLGMEVADMFCYSSDPGYDGGMDLLTAEDLRKAGIDCPMTDLETWFGTQDWADVLTK